MAIRRELLLEQLRELDWSQPHSRDEVIEHLRGVDAEMAREVHDHVPEEHNFRSAEDLLEFVLRYYWQEHQRDRLSPWGHLEPGHVPERTRDEHVSEPD